MPNPLLQDTQNNNFPSRTSVNPMQAIADFVNSNPQFRPIFDRLKNGENPKDIFYSICREKGIDPMNILNQFR